MSNSLALAVTLSVAAAVVAHAQTVRTPVAPAPWSMQADMLKWQSAMVAAQQAAIKPGDEALPCEALHKELVSSMNASGHSAVRGQDRRRVRQRSSRRSRRRAR